MENGVRAVGRQRQMERLGCQTTHLKWKSLLGEEEEDSSICQKKTGIFSVAGLEGTCKKMVL
jgi:hypothetical protein